MSEAKFPKPTAEPVSGMSEAKFPKPTANDFTS
jgi:hypothetical protein